MKTKLKDGFGIEFKESLYRVATLRDLQRIFRLEAASMHLDYFD